jgi:hypothetical protein
MSDTPADRINAEAKRLREIKRRKHEFLTQSNRSAPQDEQLFERTRRVNAAWDDYYGAAHSEAMKAVLAMKSERQQALRAIEIEKQRDTRPKDPALVAVMVEDFRSRVSAADSTAEKADAIRRVVEEAKDSGDRDVIRAARIAVADQIDPMARQLTGTSQIQIRNVGRELREIADEHPNLPALEATLAEIDHASKMLVGEVDALRVEATQPGTSTSWTDVLGAEPAPLPPLKETNPTTAAPVPTLADAVEFAKLRAEVAKLRQQQPDDGDTDGPATDEITGRRPRPTGPG